MRQLRGYEVWPVGAMSRDDIIADDESIFGTREAAIDWAKKFTKDEVPGYPIAVLDRSETPRREIGRAENGVWYWANEKRRMG